VDLGIRHIFPIHLANDAFGGTAVHNDLFNVLNRFLNGDWYSVRDASGTGVAFRLGFGGELGLGAGLPVRRRSLGPLVMCHAVW
jgi:hypothetical protein